MGKDITYYCRKLPHYQPVDGIFFITFRLAGSIPTSVISLLKKEYEDEIHMIQTGRNSNGAQSLKYLAQKRYFEKFDMLLDGNPGAGNHWLTESRIAKIVATAFHFYDNIRYDLFCYTIMSNHVHIVIDLGRNLKGKNEAVGQFLQKLSYKGNLRYPLSSITFNWKRYTALQANKILHRKGSFWQHESYDHIVRDGEELKRIVHYVMQNPTKAGLTDSWDNWKWTYVKKGLLEAL